MLSIDIIREVDTSSPDDQQLVSWVNAAYQNADENSAEISIKIVDDEEIQWLNKHYRDKDKTTNVLSFASNDDANLIEWGKYNESSKPQQHFGDIVLCAPYIEREATEQNKNRVAHWAHMVIHGALHLQGFDHINNSDAAIMERIEIDTLQLLGFENPYQ